MDLITTIRYRDCLFYLFSCVKSRLVVLLFCVVAFSFHTSSYAFQASEPDMVPDENDTVIYKKYYSGFTMHHAEMDTALDNFSLFNPIQKNLVKYGYDYLPLGNLGGAYLLVDDLTRVFSRKPFLTHYGAYLFSLDPVPVYTTRKPFTQVNYYNFLGSKIMEEKYLTILHTQNVNEDLNIGFQWNYLDNEGDFTNQKHTFGLLNFFTSYQGERYDLKLNAVYNGFSMQHFGGVDSLNYHSSMQATKNYLTNLSHANARFRNKGLLLDQEYGVFLGDQYRMNLGYRLSYDDYLMEYADNNPLQDFYPATIDSTETFDSLFARNFENSLYFRSISDHKYMPELIFAYGINSFSRAYVQHSFDSAMHGTFIQNSFYSQKTSLLLIQDKLQYWSFSGAYHYYFDGYDKGASTYDIAIKRFLGAQQQYFLHAAMDYVNKPVDPYLQNYSSNHVQWNRDLLNPEMNHYHFSLRKSDGRLTLGVDHRTMRNYVTYNRFFEPQQHNEVLQWQTAYCNYRYNLYKFSTTGRFAYHLSNQHFYAVPEISVFNSTWFDHTHTFKQTGGDLQFQIGVNTYYLSAHSAYQYAPIVNQFIYDDANRFTAGGFPVFDVFLSMKIKAVRLLFKYENLNINPEDKNNYYIYPYPVSVPKFKFGFSWNFYN